MIHVFYHASLMGDRYNDIISSCFSKIKQCGLYDAAESITMGILGDGQIDIENSGEYEKVRFVRIASDFSKSERPTIQMLWDHAQNSEGSYLYLHAKGVANPFWNHIEGEKQFISDWRNFMEYFNVERWKDCVSILKSGYDCLGVNYRQEPWKHFSGNFWWASSSYLKRTERPIESYPPDGPDRFYDERWIGLADPKAINLHASNTHHYYQPYPEHLYRR